MRFFHVDAFSAQPFAGNPAAVVLLEQAAPRAWMQSFAAEMNLSETAFVCPSANGFQLQWFTPAAEIELCGHATLASAHILWQTGLLAPEQPARFHTLSGLLTAAKCGEWICLNFPARPLTPSAPPVGLLESLGSPKIEFSGHFKEDWLLELPSEADVRAVAPDFGRLNQADCRVVMVTARSANPDFDFVSRFFAPRMGVNEDPVTGSAHCALTPYWLAKIPKPKLMAFQASRRGGVLRVSQSGERVLIEGQALTILSGELTVR